MVIIREEHRKMQKKKKKLTLLARGEIACDTRRRNANV
jgi:hypothetical protein